MRKWHAVGLRRLLLGVETVFDYELKEYNKRQKRDEIVSALRAAKEIGISLFCNFIVNPTYTAKEFQELVQFIHDNEVDYPSFTILTPIPGTGDDYGRVIERQPNGRPNWNYFDLQHPVIPTALPRDEFMHEFYNLYHVFSANYFEADSPLSLQARADREEHRRQLYRKVAMRVVSGATDGAAG